MMIFQLKLLIQILRNLKIYRKNLFKDDEEEKLKKEKTMKKIYSCAATSTSNYHLAGGKYIATTKNIENRYVT